MYTCNETQGGVYLYPLPCQPRRRPSCAWRGVRLWRIAQVRQGSIFVPFIQISISTICPSSSRYFGRCTTSQTTIEALLVFAIRTQAPGPKMRNCATAARARPSLSAYARNRPPLWKPVRQMPRDMQRWGVPPTTVSYCELRTLRRNSALSACERRPAERPGRHGGSLAAVKAAVDELWPALPTKVVKLYGSYTAYCTSVSVRRRALSLLHGHG